jgi:outer membrane protein TolC
MLGPCFKGHAQATTGITLAQAINRAQETFAKAKMARADRNAQEEKTTGSWTDLGPRVKLDYNLAQYENEMAVPAATGKQVTRPEVIKMGSMTIVQPVTGLGALAKKAMFEETQLDIKRDTYILAKSEGAFGAAELWLLVYQLDKHHQIAKASVKGVEQQLKDAQTLERVGRLNRGDVLKLELAVSEARLREIQTGNALASATAQFKEILDLDPETEVILSGELPQLFDKEISLKDALKSATDRRLDTKISRQGVELAGFGKSLAYSQFSPQINLFVKAERNFGDSYAAFPGKISRSYGVNLTWDIWNNGSHVYTLREAADQIVKAEEAAKAMDRRALIEVHNTLNSYNSNKVALGQASIAVKQAEEAYRIESVRFKTGSRSATDLILAENSQAQARGRWITAQVELINGYFKLQKSMGHEQPKIN